MSTKVTIVSEYRSFLGLRDDWNRLVAANYASGVWMRHEWYDCWWQAFGEGAEMFIVTLSEGTKMTAILPLMIMKLNIKGLRQRTLMFIANGITPRSSFIIPGISLENLKLVWDEIFKQSNNWDLAILSNIEQDNVGYTLWRDYLEANSIRHVELPERISPYLTLREGWESVQSGFGKNLRRNLNRAKTRMTKEAPFDMIECTSSGNAREALATCYEISKKSWKGQQGVDMGGSERRTKFYNLITEAAIKNGWINIWQLKFGERIIAFEYAFADSGYVMPVAADYDPQYRHFSPGAVLRSLILERLCSRGMEIYDFAGTVYDYKLYWTKSVRPHSQFWLFHSGLKSRLLYLIKAKLLPAMNRTKKSSSAETDADTNGEE